MICEVLSRKQIFKNRSWNGGLDPCLLAFPLTCWGDQSLLQVNNKGDQSELGMGRWKR